MSTETNGHNGTADTKTPAAVTFQKYWRPVWSWLTTNVVIFWTQVNHATKYLIGLFWSGEGGAKAPDVTAISQKFWEFWSWSTPYIVALWNQVNRAVKYLIGLPFWNGEAGSKAPSGAAASQKFGEVWSGLTSNIVALWNNIVALWKKANRTIKYVILLILAVVFIYILSFIHLPSFGKSKTITVIPPSPAPRRAPPKADDVKEEGVDCPTPTVVFQPWEINTIVPGADGHPLPIVYTLDLEKAHKLSVVDIDAMDMQMAIYVDDELRGLTRDFGLDKANNCGDNLRACGTGGFSAGVVVVAPGKHTVKIEWAGKEFVEGTHDMDWGEEKGRRFKWKREFCA